MDSCVVLSNSALVSLRARCGNIFDSTSRCPVPFFPSIKLNHHSQQTLLLLIFPITQASFGGGAAVSSKASLSVLDSVFEGNKVACTNLVSTCTAHGGGIASTQNALLSVHATVFRTNFVNCSVHLGCVLGSGHPLHVSFPSVPLHHVLL